MGVEIFFSYSHKDEMLRDELAKHLSIMKRQGIIDAWHDRAITAGSEWEGEINTHLNSAQIILLLISADFLASDYCYDIELKRAMERHEAGEAQVIPIILKPVDWNGATFGKLQALPKNAQPITTWHSQDEAFLNVAQGIRKVVDLLAPQKPVNQPSGLKTTAASRELKNFGVPSSPSSTFYLSSFDTFKYGNNPSNIKDSGFPHKRSPGPYLLYSLSALVIGSIGFAIFSKNVSTLTQPGLLPGSIEAKPIPSPSPEVTPDRASVTSPNPTQPAPPTTPSSNTTDSEPEKSTQKTPLDVTSSEKTNLSQHSEPSLPQNNFKYLVYVVYRSAQKTQANKISQVLRQKGYVCDPTDTEFGESTNEPPLQSGEIRILYKRHSQQQFKDVKTSLEALGLSVTQERLREKFRGDIQIQLF